MAYAGTRRTNSQICRVLGVCVGRPMLERVFGRPQEHGASRLMHNIAHGGEGVRTRDVDALGKPLLDPLRRMSRMVGPRYGSDTMPMPRWVARLNRRVFNPLELRRGTRPVLTHVGRVSGTIYHTPLDAHPVDGGYLFFVVYGPESDWVRNVRAAGAAVLTVDGREVRLEAPRLLDREAAASQLAEGTKLPPAFARVTDFLRMDLTS